MIRDIERDGCSDRREQVVQIIPVKRQVLELLGSDGSGYPALITAGTEPFELATLAPILAIIIAATAASNR